MKMSVDMLPIKVYLWALVFEFHVILMPRNVIVVIIVIIQPIKNIKIFIAHGL